jgi:beta-mannosidase
LNILDQESVSLINRLKHHACIVFWCGGNELFNNWSKMTDQSAALRLLNARTFYLDPTRPFIPTAPVMGMGHGHYVFRDTETNEEVFQWMPRSKNTAYSEFGISSVADVDILKQIIPDDELFPPEALGAWEAHHAFGSWEEDTWLMKNTLNHYFGEHETLEAMVSDSQKLQAEGLKFIFEEARRQEPYCSMALNWCFCEPWPTAANTSIISYPNKPKPAYYQVKNACRDILFSARVTKFSWQPGETFSAEIYLLSHFSEKQIAEIRSGNFSMNAYMQHKDERVKLLTWQGIELKSTKNLTGPVARFVLPDWEKGWFQLILECNEKPEWNSEYHFLIREKIRKTEKQITLNH